MIDLHSHILPGVDDGARTLEDSLGIARAAVAAGVTVIAATPHVRDDYPTSAEAMEGLVVSTRRALDAEGVPLELLPGGEIALDYLPRLDEAELRRFGLGGNPDLLLLEFPYAGWPPGLASTLADLRARGFTAVLAHPERSEEVQAAPAHLWPLVEAGTLVQLTAASVTGRFGSGPRAAALDLLELELAHLVSGDVHSPGARGAALGEVTSALGGDADLTSWLTLDVPAALVRGEPPPPRPAPRRRGLLGALNPFRR